MSRRADVLKKHLQASPCIGEMENRVVEGDDNEDIGGVLQFRFERRPIKIVFADPSAADERYGGSGDVAILEGELLHPGTQSSTVFVFMHPSGIQNLLPMPVAMGRSGLHVITCTSRYPNNDSCLIMEKVAMDLGACLHHAKTKLGYQKTVLCGWSGGGSLSSFYQAQAEAAQKLTDTPAGDKVDLNQANMPSADGLCIMAAHTSRAKIFTEWIDPAVMDENDPSKRDETLDIFNPKNKPPFSPTFIERYRKAQVERNRRITRWVWQQLEELERSRASHPNDWRMSRRDIPFMVHCTQADLRRLDVSIDPNGRKPTALAELAAENHSPVGLARFTTLRSWLSQWSFDESRADGPKSLKHTSIPTLVLANEADHLVPLSHPRAMFDAIPHHRKKLLLVEDASHYYFGQKRLMVKAISEVKKWLQEENLI